MRRNITTLRLYASVVTPFTGANSLADVVPQLLAQGLMALRQNAIMPLLVNRDYEDEAQEQGNSVDVPIPSAVTAVAVTPSPTPPANADQSPTKVNIPLDQWYEAPFYLTDKEQREVMDGYIPMTASEAIKALANNVDNYIFAQFYPEIYGFVGTPGTTPFSTDVSDATQARAVLTKQLAPLQDLRFVMDPDAEAKALELRAFHDMSFSGQALGIMTGQVGTKFGFNFAMDQNVPTHTAGTASGATTDATGYAVGLKTVTLASAGTGTILVGDIVTFAGDTQTYTITAGDADVSNGGTISFEPGLKVAIPTSATAITVKASHVVNLAFHRDAFAFASRPLADQDFNGGNLIQSATDPVSGLSLRLEVSRQHKQTRWSFDILYGGKVVRPELASRVAG